MSCSLGNLVVILGAMAFGTRW